MDALREKDRRATPTRDRTALTSPHVLAARQGAPRLLSAAWTSHNSVSGAPLSADITKGMKLLDQAIVTKAFGAHPASQPVADTLDSRG